MKETLKLYDMREWPPLPDKLGEALQRAAAQRKKEKKKAARAEPEACPMPPLASSSTLATR